MRYNPPPNWPPPPTPDWQPPDGWRPNPAWAPLPTGWPLWIDDQPPSTWGFFTNKVWIAIATVASTLTVVLSIVTYTQSNSGSGGLTIAALSLGTPLDVTALDRADPGGQGPRPADDVAVAPIDVTLKNDSDSTAEVTSVTATIIHSSWIAGCGNPGAGGVLLAAEYSLVFPRRTGSSDLETTPVSTPIDFAIGPRQSGRMAVTVGPEEQPANSAYVIALTLAFGLADGATVTTDPLTIGTTKALIDRLVQQAYTDAQSPTCARKELPKIDAALKAGAVQSASVKELRAAYLSLAAK